MPTTATSSGTDRPCRVSTLMRGDGEQVVGADDRVGVRPGEQCLGGRGPAAYVKSPASTRSRPSWRARALGGVE